MKMIDMLNSYKKMWSNGLNFKGKSSRKDFWLVWLLNSIIMIILSFIGYEYNLEILEIVYSIIITIPVLALTIRRLHDTNTTGWFLLWTIIPVIGTIIVLFRLCEKTVINNNRY